MYGDQPLQPRLLELCLAMACGDRKHAALFVSIRLTRKMGGRYLNSQPSQLTHDCLVSKYCSTTADTGAGKIQREPRPSMSNHLCSGHRLGCCHSRLVQQRISLSACTSPSNNLQSSRLCHLWCRCPRRSVLHARHRHCRYTPSWKVAKVITRPRSSVTPM